MFIPRNPFMPKAVWWKKYQEIASLGKRTIYVATNNLGFEVLGFPQELRATRLINGKLNCKEEVEYIEITNGNEPEIEPTKSICLLGKYFMYNPETQALEEQDIVDEGIEIVQAKTNDNIIRFENSIYVRQFAFDIFTENDLQSSLYQPLSGLPVNSEYLTLKTFSFCVAKNKPRTSDLVFFDNLFWVIEDCRETYLYAPKRKAILHLALKQIQR